LKKSLKLTSFAGLNNYPVEIENFLQNHLVIKNQGCGRHRLT
jgi:hypothetical protein